MSKRGVTHRGRELSSYVDPHPGAQGADKVFSECGNCDGSGVYSGHSSWIWAKGKQVRKWCFQCDGSGRYSLTVATLRKRAKEAAYQRDYADEINAARDAAIAESNAKIFAADWDAAAAEQARRAALVGGFAGEIGERVKDLIGEIKVAKTYDASYGYRKATGMFLIIELAGGQIVKIAGTGRTLFGHARGDKVSVTGTVKAHETYQGQDQTVLTRAKLEGDK